MEISYGVVVFFFLAPAHSRRCGWGMILGRQGGDGLVTSLAPVHRCSGGCMAPVSYSRRAVD
jgi:hypothetical protein